MQYQDWLLLFQLMCPWRTEGTCHQLFPSQRSYTCGVFYVIYPAFSIPAMDSTPFRGTEDKSGHRSPTQSHGLPSDPSHLVWDPLLQFLTLARCPPHTCEHTPSHPK